MHASSVALTEVMLATRVPTVDPGAMVESILLVRARLGGVCSKRGTCPGSQLFCMPPPCLVDFQIRLNNARVFSNAIPK